MPSFSVGSATQDGVNIVVYTGNYSWFRVFVRPSSSSTAIFDRYFNETQDFSTYVSGLSAGTSYTVNVAYGNSSGSATNWIGAQTFRTLDPIEVVTMGIACGVGISSISVQYHDENGNVSSRTCTGTEYIFVEKNTTQYVTSIEFSAGYSHPVNCSGQTTWQMTNSSGTFLDSALSISASSKTFTFTATQMVTVTMGIVCGTGISSVSLRYYGSDGNLTTTTVYGTEYLSVAANTTQYVTQISFSAGYSHPVNCSGQTTWQMTNSDGAFLDAALSMTTAAKTFIFTATEVESSSGTVWIGGNYYQPYVYFNGSWRSVVPYIYYNGSWHTVGE